MPWNCRLRRAACTLLDAAASACCALSTMDLSSCGVCRPCVRLWSCVARSSLPRRLRCVMYCKHHNLCPAMQSGMTCTNDHTCVWAPCEPIDAHSVSVGSLYWRPVPSMYSPSLTSWQAALQGHQWFSAVYNWVGGEWGVVRQRQRAPRSGGAEVRGSCVPDPLLTCDYNGGRLEAERACGRPNLSALAGWTPSA